MFYFKKETFGFYVYLNKLVYGHIYGPGVDELLVVAVIH
jgi:hypothetical protein